MNGHFGGLILQGVQCEKGSEWPLGRGLILQGMYCMKGSEWPLGGVDTARNVLYERE